MGSKGIFDVEVDDHAAVQQRADRPPRQAGRSPRTVRRVGRSRRTPLRRIGVFDHWVPISDPQDPRIHVFQGLRDHTLRQLREGSGGDMDGVFVGEGDIVVQRALSAGYLLESVLVDGSRRKPIPQAIEASGAPIYGAAPQVLQHITGYHLHRGLLGCFRRRPVAEPAAVLAVGQDTPRPRRGEQPHQSGGHPAMRGRPRCGRIHHGSVVLGPAVPPCRQGQHGRGIPTSLRSRGRVPGRSATDPRCGLRHPGTHAWRRHSLQRPQLRCRCTCGGCSGKRRTSV